MEFLNALHVILCLLTSCSPRPDAKVTDVNHDVKNDYHSIDNATLSSSTSVVSELPDNAENDISDLWRNKVVNPRLKRQIMQVALGYSPPDVKVCELTPYFIIVDWSVNNYYNQFYKEESRLLNEF